MSSRGDKVKKSMKSLGYRKVNLQQTHLTISNSNTRITPLYKNELIKPDFEATVASGLKKDPKRNHGLRWTTWPRICSACSPVQH
jgi:hypothetical protein